MKGCLKILVLFLILTSCKQQINAVDIAKLNGYWEIEKVVLPDDGNKDYKINETVDFFTIKNNEGFRHKVTPQFNGKYLVNEFAERVKIVVNDDKTFIEYSTDFAKWKDELVSISDTELVVKNDADIQYQYKRPIPFSVK